MTNKWIVKFFNSKFFLTFSKLFLLLLLWIFIVLLLLLWKYYDLWNLIPCKIDSMKWHWQFYDKYVNYITDKFLRVYRLKSSSLVVRIFLSEYIDNFFYFSQGCVQSCQHWYACQNWDIYRINIHLPIRQNIFFPLVHDEKLYISHIYFFPCEQLARNPMYLKWASK